jgi:tRNA pseudouridine32 synthase/23S rRNA pseudouridine746 synthase
MTMPIDVIYSDPHLLLVNKPSGLLSVPGRGEDKQDCVVKRVQEDYPTARIVHRLDCATSGLMVLALDAASHRELSRQFHDRETEKHYIARVYGHLEEMHGEVEHPLRCDWDNRPKQIVDPIQGKSAKTLWQVLEQSEHSTRVRLTPITGRSHQLRVHMQALGHPILGDRFYAHPEALGMADRLQLHAQYLAFTHPDKGERQQHLCPCPF